MAFITPQFTLDVATITDSNNVATWPVALRTVSDPDNQGRVHKFLQFQNGSGNVALVNGGTVYHDTSPDWVTNDVSDTSIYRIEGIARAVLTDLNGGWFQTSGPNLSAMLTDGNVVEGSVLIGNASTDNGCLPYTAGTNDSAVFAFALADDVGTAQAVDTVILLGRTGR